MLPQTMVRLHNKSFSLRFNLLTLCASDSDDSEPALLENGSYDGSETDSMTDTDNLSEGESNVESETGVSLTGSDYDEYSEMSASETDGSHRQGRR